MYILITQWKRCKKKKILKALYFLKFKTHQNGAITILYPLEKASKLKMLTIQSGVFFGLEE